MKVKPAKGNLLVKPISLDELSTKSLLSAVQEEKKPEVGEIVDIGEPTEDDLLPIDDIKPGDIAAYRRFGKAQFLIDAQEYIFVSFRDVVGIIRKE